MERSSRWRIKPGSCINTGTHVNALRRVTHTGVLSTEQMHETMGCGLACIFRASSSSDASPELSCFTDSPTPMAGRGLPSAAAAAPAPCTAAEAASASVPGLRQARTIVRPTRDASPALMASSLEPFSFSSSGHCREGERKSGLAALNLWAPSDIRQSLYLCSKEEGQGCSLLTREQPGSCTLKVRMGRPCGGVAR